MRLLQGCEGIHGQCTDQGTVHLQVPQLLPQLAVWHGRRGTSWRLSSHCCCPPEAPAPPAGSHCVVPDISRPLLLRVVIVLLLLLLALLLLLLSGLQDQRGGGGLLQERTKLEPCAVADDDIPLAAAVE